MPHDDKQYLKKLRTIKLVAYMVLSALAALLVGLVLVWIFDKAPDSPFTHGWNLFFVIVFYRLVLCIKVIRMEIRHRDGLDAYYSLLNNE